MPNVPNLPKLPNIFFGALAVWTILYLIHAVRTARAMTAATAATAAHAVRLPPRRAAIADRHEQRYLSRHIRARAGRAGRRLVARAHRSAQFKFRLAIFALIFI